MRTKKIPLLLAIAALGLTACGGDADTSDSTLGTDDTTTSETADDSTSTGESIDSTSSSEDPTATSTSEPIDTGSSDADPIDTTPTYNWPEAQISALMVSLLGYEGDVAIPAPSTELDGGRTYTIDTTYVWSSSRDPLILVTATGDFTGYIDEVVAAGWMKPDYGYGATYLHSADEDLALQILVYDYDSTADTTEVAISASQGVYATWAATFIQDKINDVAGAEATALPVPENVELFLYGGGYTGYYYYFYVYSDTDMADYISMLAENGFTAFDYWSATYYMDPTLQYFVELNGDYYDTYGYIYISVYVYDFYFYTAEESTDLDDMVNLYFNYVAGDSVTATLPLLRNVDYDLGHVTGSYSGGYVQLYLYKFGNGALVDLTDDYAALLNANVAWYYVEEEGVWIDRVTATVSVSLKNQEESGMNVSLLVEVTTGEYSGLLPNASQGSVVIGTYRGTMYDNYADDAGTIEIVIADEESGTFTIVYESGYRYDDVPFTYTCDDDGVFTGYVSEYELTFTLSYDAATGTISGDINFFGSILSVSATLVD